MSNKILVSALTPNLHMDAYMPLFLEQYPSQTYFEKMEVIFFLNDPSEFELKLVHNFQKKYPGRLKYILSREPQSISKSMNECIKAAQGEYVCIWNTDDLRTPNSIELQAKILQNNPDIGVAYGNFTIVHFFGTTIGKFIRLDAADVSRKTRDMLYGPYYMFRKSLVKKVGMFDEQLRSGADYDLVMRLAFNTKSRCVKQSIGYYLDEGKGVSTRPDSKQLVEALFTQLRYGIYDNLRMDFAPKAIEYDIHNVYFDGKKHPVADFVPNYKKMIDERYTNDYWIGKRKLKWDLFRKLREFKYVLIKTFKLRKF